MEDILNFKYRKGVQDIYPAHPMVSNWLFPAGEEDEAALVHFMAKVAAKSGMDANDMQHLFPAVLRMLKNHSTWSGQAPK